jgi:hypothetical protein
MEERVVETLSRSRRLTVLVVLKERDGAMTPAELATAVASRESGLSPAAVDDDHVERVLLSLRRSHLPALSDAGLLTRAPDPDSDANASGAERVGLAADVADARRVLTALFESDAGNESTAEA